MTTDNWRRQGGLVVPVDDESEFIRVDLIEYHIMVDPDTGKSHVKLSIDNPKLETFALMNPQMFYEAMGEIATAFRKVNDLVKAAPDELISEEIRNVARELGE